MNVFNRVSGPFILAAVLSNCLLLGGCQKFRDLLAGNAHDHNLHYVKCDNANIYVNANTGTDYTDEIVFLCKDHTVTWKTPSAAGTITVDFGTASPLASGQILLTGQGQIGPFPVVGLPAGTRSKAFKYQLTVGGNSFDPHVIIMGSN
jgi:hypothetical protein